jgi:predicted porin
MDKPKPVSRRISFYAEALFQHTGGGNGIVAFNAEDYTYGASSSNERVVVAVGMLHRF